MSRFRRATHNVVSSYVQLAATALFGLASMPVALHFLHGDKERFGLWVLMSTIAGYLSLIDMGMSGSVARLLIDYKDRKAEGVYGSLFKTGWLVLGVQGLVVLVVGCGLAPALAAWLRVGLRSEFIQLLGWQSAALAVGFALRIFSHLLYAHQRSDIYNYSQAFAMGLNLLLLWVFFRAGHGIFSMAWASLGSVASSGLICLVSCGRLGVFPPRGAWGRVCGRRFRELFSFGKDMFLVTLGTQLIIASQALIITRNLELGAATVWGAGTRLFFLVSQVLWRLSDMAGPAFSEMMVRGERGRLRVRYREVVLLTASLSGFCAVGFVLCNSLFVRVWLRGEVVWWPVCDLGLGVWMVLLAVLHCHNGLVLLTKEIAFMRYVYFLEGMVILVVAQWCARVGGLLGVILCSIGCSVLFSGAYGVWRIHRYLELPLREVGWNWLGLMFRTLGLCTPVALGAWWLGQWVVQPLPRLVVYAVGFGIPGGIILLRYGISKDFQHELSRRAPRSVSPLLRRVFLASA